jgi:hypothetical protein
MAGAVQEAQLWPALSIKQPWAAMIVHGLKTVEVRSWVTGRRGPILIHASKSPEANPAAWAWITTPALMQAAGLVGGIIGTAEIAECRSYTTAAEYEQDAARHRTPPGHFRPPRLYGFVLAHARPLPFLPWVGNTNFFSVTMALPPQPRPAAAVPAAKPRKAKAPRAKIVVRLPEESP